MVTANIELYEAVKDKLGAEAARMLAEAVPQSQELATKADLAELKAEIRGWMLTFFVPLWLGVYGTLIAILIKS